MPVLNLGPEDGLYYEYDAPQGTKPTFVFVNALTGNTGTWQAEIGPSLRAEGFGTLAYNFRGQAESPFKAGLALDEALIVGDLKRLMEEVAPPRPIPVGLSIGGLYAAKAVLGGAQAEGLVLLNTLRRIGPRLAWVNDVMVRAAEVGGIQLLMDFYMPLLLNEGGLEGVRSNFLGTSPYTPLDPAHGHFNLMQHAGGTDWEIAYEKLSLPVLVVSGLQDRVFYDAAVVAELTARLPNATTVEMPNAGHLIPIERPTELTRVLKDFAAQLG